MAWSVNVGSSLLFTESLNHGCRLSVTSSESLDSLQHCGDHALNTTCINPYYCFFFSLSPQRAYVWGVCMCLIKSKWRQHSEGCHRLLPYASQAGPYSTRVWWGDNPQVVWMLPVVTERTASKLEPRGLR